MTKYDCRADDARAFIRAHQANNTHKTEDLLCELFDNAIDAGATIIEADVKGSRHGAGKGSFTIADNGKGVENIQKLLSVGFSTKMLDDTIGRYGVGAKDCFFIVGGLASTLRIEAATETERWDAVIDWKDQSTWEFDQNDEAPDMQPFPGSSSTGLRLSMSGCHRVMPAATQLKVLLSQTYWPWLNNPGNVMEVGGERIAPPQLPITDNRFNGSARQGCGTNKSFVISGGLLQQEHPLNGVTVFKGNRVLYYASAVGLGDCMRSGLCVLVQLHGAWETERNKKGLSEAHEQELQQTLAPLLQEVARLAGDRSMRIEHDARLDMLNEDFGAAMEEVIGRAARPKSRGGDGASHTVQGTDRKVREATEVRGDGPVRQRGTTKPRNRRSPFIIECLPGNDAELIGTVDTRNRRVTLHKNNETIARLWASKDVMLSNQTLKVAAAALIAEAMRDEQQLPFTNQFSRMMSLCVAGRSEDVI
jgi:hypothetical protein